MNEAETRAELIEPKLIKNGWDSKTTPSVKIHREFVITAGRIKSSGGREKQLTADYVLEYKGRKLAVIEAKSNIKSAAEGVQQAKNYANKLNIKNSYSTNGLEIYYIDMDSGSEEYVQDFHTPEELWEKTVVEFNDWQKQFDKIPFELRGNKKARFYQEKAVERVMDAIANKQHRILLTLATGTGKTFIAFQIAWKLYQSRWNKNYDKDILPKILFLADRNILADQAFNNFDAFPQDALIRIKPKNINKSGKVPTNGSIFFTIFQTFMTGDKTNPIFNNYKKDFFDLIFVDECHRGGANDESNWREILEHFEPAVQIGLTATPKRNDNVDTYKYFGEPVFSYSLKDGINDGFLTPFKAKRIKTDLDEYTYESDDTVLEGEIDEDKTYTEKDFNKIIEIKEREKLRVKILMKLINQNDKTLVFCANQNHAAAIRDLINQFKDSKEPNYCVRVTANDGEIGEQFLREFQDNEKSIPAILTTSQKLSTGVDALNIRNIVLLRPVNNMVEFKQIIGRGTRVFDGKNFFTIYDFVNACEKFNDPEWDGEPEVCETCGKLICICDEDTSPKCGVCGSNPCECILVDFLLCTVCGKIPCSCYTVTEKPCEDCGNVPCICGIREENDTECPICGKFICVCRGSNMIKIKLKDGKELNIRHSVETKFMGSNGEVMTVQEFIESLYGKLPAFYKDEEHLRYIWANPVTRKTLLDKLEQAGFSRDNLLELQKIINAENSDLFDVLEFISYSIPPVTREKRVESAKGNIFALLDKEQKEFLEFVLGQYIKSGVDELDNKKLSGLLNLKYKSIADAELTLGSLPKIRALFVNFQKHLYDRNVG